MTAAARALDARMLVARRSSAANCEIATATPTTAIDASTTRRMKRSRVSVTGSSSIPQPRAHPAPLALDDAVDEEDEHRRDDERSAAP